MKEHLFRLLALVWRRPQISQLDYDRTQRLISGTLLNLHWQCRHSGRQRFYLSNGIGRVYGRQAIISITPRHTRYRLWCLSWRGVDYCDIELPIEQLHQHAMKPQNSTTPNTRQRNRLHIAAPHLHYPGLRQVNTPDAQPRHDSRAFEKQLKHILDHHPRPD